MEIVKVKNKYQVVIPEEIRGKIGVEIGDFLEVKVVGNSINLEPKAVVDKWVGEALEEIKLGKTKGPFRNSNEMFKFLNTRSKRK